MDATKLNSKRIVSLNKSSWNKIKLHNMHLDVNLVKCQKYLFPKSKNKKLLYIGFGEGENLSYLISQGFECYGTEISKKRLEFTKKKLSERKQKATLKLVDSNNLPFKNNFFDVVVAWQSLYYNTPETLNEILEEIRRALKTNGTLLASMISTKQKLLCNKKIAPNTYKPSPKTGQQNCVVYCFEKESQIKKIYKKFKNIKIGNYSSFLFKSPNFHYVIYCERPKNGK